MEEPTTTPEDRLREFQSLVNMAPYKPLPTAPSWLAALGRSAETDFGAQALLGPNGVSVASQTRQRLRAVPEAASLFVAVLASRMRGTGRKLAVGLPPTARHLPLLLASSVILANTIDQSQQERAKVGGGVLVVSPDLDVRSRYCDLHVKSVQLEEAHPGSRMLPDGRRVSLRASTGGTVQPGVCFFLPRLDLPRRIEFRPALIVLDLRYAAWVKRAASLAQWVSKLRGRAGALALYSIGDAQTLSALTSAGFSAFPLDHAAVRACSERVREPVRQQEGLSVDWSLADAPEFLARQHEIVPVPEADAIEALLEDTNRLLDEQRDADAPDIMRARWVLAVMSQVPVPLVWYEETAQSMGRYTLRGTIARLGSRSRERNLGPVIQTLRMQLENLYRTLERSNPRSEALRRLLPVVSAKFAEPVLLLTRDEVTERALRAWLELDALPDADWLGRVDVRGFPRYAATAAKQYGAALVNGVFPRRYQWAAGGALGAQVIFLVYPNEAGVVQRQLERVYGKESRDYRASLREGAISWLVPGMPSGAPRAECEIPPLRLRMPSQARQAASKRKRRPHITIRGLEGLAGAMQAAQEAAAQQEKADQEAGLAWQEMVEEDDVLPDDTAVPGDMVDGEGVLAREIRAVSRTHRSGAVWLAEGDLVECARPSRPGELLRFPPSEIRPGDVLLRTEDGRRSTLFEQLVDLAEMQPRLKYLATYRRAWRQAVQRLVARYGTPSGVDLRRMLQALQQEGARISTEIALRYWVRDQVIGPEAIQSIRAVGRVSGMESLVHQAKDFDRAFRRIRAIHQGIGRRLSTVIRRSFAQFAGSTPDHVAQELDERLALPLDELLETIDLAEVTAVGEVRRVVPYWIGRWRSLT